MPGQPLTPAQLRELATDPNVTAADAALLSPEEKQQFLAFKGAPAPPAQSQAQRITQQLNGLFTGVAKGAGETAVSAGRAVRATPMGYVTDALAKLVGPEGTDPEAAFSQSSDQMGLGANSDAEKVGKIGEQIAEMFAGAGPVRKAVIEGGVRMIPNSAGPAAMKLLNRGAAVAGRSIGEGLNAGTNAMMHGDGTPGRSAGIAAAGPLAGEGLAMAAPLIKNSEVQRILSLLAGIGGVHLAGGMTPMGLGAGFGVYGLGRSLASQMMKRPTAVNTTQRVARRVIPQLLRTGAAVESQSRRER